LFPWPWKKYHQEDPLVELLKPGATPVDIDVAVIGKQDGGVPCGHIVAQDILVDPGTGFEYLVCHELFQLCKTGIVDQEVFEAPVPPELVEENDDDAKDHNIDNRPELVSVDEFIELPDPGFYH
jgi:hypothetical protein